MIDTDTGASHDIVVCLKCGFQVNIMILFISHTRFAENTVYLCLFLFTGIYLY